MKFRRTTSLVLAAVLTTGCVAPTWQENQVSSWQRQVKRDPGARDDTRQWTYRNWRLTDEEERQIALGSAAAFVAALAAGALLLR